MNEATYTPEKTGTDLVSSEAYDGECISQQQQQQEPQQELPDGESATKEVVLAHTEEGASDDYLTVPDSSSTSKKGRPTTAQNSSRGANPLQSSSTSKEATKPARRKEKTRTSSSHSASPSQYKPSAVAVPSEKLVRLNCVPLIPSCIVCALMHLAVTVLCIVGLQLDVYIRHAAAATTDTCYRFFSGQCPCDASAACLVREAGWGCRARSQLIQTASALLIIGAVMAFVASVLTVVCIRVRRCVVTFLVYVFAGVAQCALFLSFAILAVIYTRPMCGAYLGANECGKGFVLGAVAWVLQLVTTVFSYVVV